MPLEQTDIGVLNNYTQFYQAEIRVAPPTDREDTDALSQALYRSESITELNTDLAVLSLLPKDRNQTKFARSFSAAATAMINLFKPFFTTKGEYDQTANPDTFKHTWDDSPTEINQRHLPQIIESAGIELPPGITPDNLKDKFSWHELLELTLRLLPPDLRHNLGETLSKETFDQTILGEIDKMMTNDSTKNYATELRPKMLAFLSRDQSKVDSTSTLYPALELKARTANLVWQVCQPFRYAKDVATTKEHTSNRLSKVNFEPFDEMLRAVYESHLENQTPQEAIILTSFELWKDLSH